MTKTTTLKSLWMRSVLLKTGIWMRTLVEFYRTPHTIPTAYRIIRRYLPRDWTFGCLRAGRRRVVGRIFPLDPFVYTAARKIQYHATIWRGIRFIRNGTLLPHDDDDDDEWRVIPSVSDCSLWIFFLGHPYNSCNKAWSLSFRFSGGCGESTIGKSGYMMESRW